MIPNLPIPGAPAFNIEKGARLTFNDDGTLIIDVDAKNIHLTFTACLVEEQAVKFDTWKCNDEIISGSFIASDIEKDGRVHVTSHYQKETHILQINYCDEQGYMISAPFEQEFEEGETYEVPSPEIEGYELVDPEQFVISGTMGHEDLEFDAIYKAVEPVQKHVLTIQYVDESGKTVAPTYTNEFEVGAEYNVQSPVVEGYEFVNKDQATIKGVMGAQDVSVKVAYKLSEKPQPQPEPPHVTPSGDTHSDSVVTTNTSQTGDNLLFVCICLALLALIAINLKFQV